MDRICASSLLGFGLNKGITISVAPVIQSLGEDASAMADFFLVFG